MRCSRNYCYDGGSHLSDNCLGIAAKKGASNRCGSVHRAQVQLMDSKEIKTVNRGTGPVLVRIVPWIVSGLGLIILVVQIVNSTIVGEWVDQNSAVSFPNSVPDFIIAGLGVIVCVLGAVSGVASLGAHGSQDR